MKVNYLITGKYKNRTQKRSLQSHSCCTLENRQIWSTTTSQWFRFDLFKFKDAIIDKDIDKNIVFVLKSALQLVLYYQYINWLNRSICGHGNREKGNINTMTCSVRRNDSNKLNAKKIFTLRISICVTISSNANSSSDI